MFNVCCRFVCVLFYLLFWVLPTLMLVSHNRLSFFLFLSQERPMIIPQVISTFYYLSTNMLTNPCRLPYEGSFFRLVLCYVVPYQRIRGVVVEIYRIRFFVFLLRREASFSRFAFYFVSAALTSILAEKRVGRNPSKYYDENLPNYR